MVAAVALLAGGVGGVGHRQIIRKLGRLAAAVALRSICTLTDEPTGGVAPTDEKSEPSTTCTTCPVPVIRSTFGVRKRRRHRGGGLLIAR